MCCLTRIISHIFRLALRAHSSRAHSHTISFRVNALFYSQMESSPNACGKHRNGTDKNCDGKIGEPHAVGSSRVAHSLRILCAQARPTASTTYGILVRCRRKGNRRIDFSPFLCVSRVRFFNTFAIFFGYSTARTKRMQCSIAMDCVRRTEIRTKTDTNPIK